MGRLKRGIELSELPRYVFDAIELTRSLGVRYIWIDSLCVVHDDGEEYLNAMSRLSEIYSSATLTIAPVGTNDETVESCIDSAVLRQPFSIFLDWSPPMVAKSCSDRLFTTKNFSRRWGLQGTLLEATRLWDRVGWVLERQKKAAKDIAAATQSNAPHTPRDDILDPDRRNDAAAVGLGVGNTETRFDEPNREIDQGVHHVEAGKNFEALAVFMKARELVSAFKSFTLASWKIHALATANIALVYQMQHLPAAALDIAEASMALQTKMPDSTCNPTLE